MTGSDYIIAYTTLTATRIVSLPPVAIAGSGVVYVIKDQTGSASTLVMISVDPSGTETIDGTGSLSITAPRGSMRIYTDGVEWFTI